MDAFAKSDDERDFYLDHQEGFIIYADLDKTEDELETLKSELEKNSERYCMIPKLTFYETKKIMEGFVNEKVYDIDTKEKLLEIIQTKEARENFLEFIYDHHFEMEKWQQYYQERSRIRIIEWLRQNQFEFVFEEDLDFPKNIVESLKVHLFEPKVEKEVQSARKELFSKAKTYYSSEALNPRPKRGRPPKQAIKLEFEPQITTDMYRSVPSGVRPFLFTPDINQFTSMTFSTKFDSEQPLGSKRRNITDNEYDLSVETLNQKLSLLRSISSRWIEKEPPEKKSTHSFQEEVTEFEEDEEEEEHAFSLLKGGKKQSASSKTVKPSLPKKQPAEKITPKSKNGVKVKGEKIIEKKPIFTPAQKKKGPPIPKKKESPPKKIIATKKSPVKKVQTSKKETVKKAVATKPKPPVKNLKKKK